MAKAAKLRAARERQRAAEQREQEAKELELNWDRIRNMRSGFSSESQPQTRKHYSDAELRRRLEGRTHRDLPRQTAGFHTGPSIEKPALSEEMQQREQRAQVEIRKKKGRVAVLYNKGGYQYVTDDADPKTFGRK